jgi:hypothetical protein
VLIKEWHSIWNVFIGKMPTHVQLYESETLRSQHCMISAPADPDAKKPPLHNHCYATQNKFFYILPPWNFETY